MRKALLLIAAVLFLIPLHSQNLREFSPNMKIFPEEVLFYISYGDGLNDEETEIVGKFKKYWDSTVFNIDEKDKIMFVANFLLSKKVSPKPQFYNYIRVVTQFKIKNQDPKSFSNWLTSFETFINEKKTTTAGISKVLAYTRNLVEKDAINIFAAGKWIPRTLKYHFEEIDKRFMVVFDKTDLVGYNIKEDSIVIKDTKGKIDLLDMKWFGEGGTVTWERAAIPANEVSVILNKYTIDLNQTAYKADSVEFTNTKYFSKPVMGVLEDRITHITSPDRAGFPKFETYNKTFSIKNLYPNIDYKGGYSMQGQKFIGKGTTEEPAKLSFYFKDTLRILARSNFFVFSPEKINGINSRISIFLLKDYIYHGNVSFSFVIKKQELTVTQSDEYSAKGPFQDTYHKIDINFEQLRWVINEPLIYLSMRRGAAVGKAFFESFNYFDRDVFDRLMGMDEQHPLYALKKFSDKFRDTDFPVYDYALYVKHSPDQVRTEITQMMVLGYLTYDVENDYIRLRPKLFETVKASLGRIDYDVIKFESNTVAPKENATLNIRNFDLKINGIPFINVSKIQDVYIYPDSSTITMKSNRSFAFAGRIDAGLFSFFGKTFYFNYDSFKVDMQKMDSIHIRILLDSLDEFGHPVQRKLNSTVEITAGFLYIDKPDNKSGVKKNPQYPIFNCVKPAFVFYNKANKAYGNDFFFEIYPFTFDSLNTYNAKDLRLKGRLSSAGIFPDMEQYLVVQKDYSLGFTLDTAINNLQAYGGKGEFDIKLSLSNSGLRGSGNLKYLTSTTTSTDFRLYPDSMNTVAKNFNIQKTPPTYPYVNVDTAGVRWKPKQDKMLVKNLRDPFIVIDDRTKLTGYLDLRPSGLNGSGFMDLTNATLNSDHFNYTSEQIHSDTTEFNLLSLKNTGMTMKTQNVQAHIDYTTRKGEFKSNTGASFTEFPENQYVSYLDAFTWDMEKKEVSMTSQTTHEQPYVAPDSLYHMPQELVGAKFISVKKSQDSLSFITPLAVYDYKANIIKAQKVKYIRVADALIFPDQGNVVVEEKAVMRLLSKAAVMANIDTKFHNFHSGQISIQSSKSYTGGAYYDFHSQVNGIQKIFFSEMKVDTSVHTIANGSLTEPDSFLLSPMFRYIGKVNLRSTERLLYFDGAAQIRIECDTNPEAWVYFKSLIDPFHIFIPLGETLKDVNRKNLYAGTLLSSEPRIHVYSTFMGQRDDYSDKNIVTAGGFLTYDSSDVSYKIASMEKLQNVHLPGNMLQLRRDSCIQHGEGKLSMCVELGQLKLNSVGFVKHVLPADELTLNISLGINFNMLDVSMAQMAADIDTFSKNIPINVSSYRQMRKMRDLLGKDKAEAMMEELTLYGKLKEIPESLKYTIFISDVNLYWNKRSRSYCSKGQIGLGHVGTHQLNRYIEGYLEITRKKSGDFLDLYIKINDNLWYYFGYTRSVMQVLSSERRFTEPIQLMKPEQRTMKTRRSEVPYTYLVSTTMKFQDFIARFESYSKVVEEEEEEEVQPAEEEEDNNDEGGKKKKKNREKEKEKEDENIKEEEVKVP